MKSDRSISEVILKTWLIQLLLCCVKQNCCCCWCGYRVQLLGSIFKSDVQAQGVASFIVVWEDPGALEVQFIVSWDTRFLEHVSITGWKKCDKNCVWKSWREQVLARRSCGEEHRQTAEWSELPLAWKKSTFVLIFLGQISSAVL